MKNALPGQPGRAGFQSITTRVQIAGICSHAGTCNQLKMRLGNDESGHAAGNGECVPEESSANVTNLA